MAEFRALLAGGGEMGERIRTFDWAATPLGHPRDWPQSLRSALSICLNSSFPTAIYWGRDLRLLYNDAWSFIPGPRHPDALGRPASEVWADIWPVIEPQLRSVMETGRGFSTQDEYLPMRRFGRIEETYWDYAFTPIAGEDGSVHGILNQGRETTGRVLSHRRTALLTELNDRLRALSHPDEIVATALELLGSGLDVGRLGYGEIDSEAGTIRIERCRVRDGMPDIAGTLELGSFGTELHESLRSGRVFHVDDAFTDPRVADPELAARYAAIGVRAGISAPVLQDGVYAAALFAQDNKPRSWTDHHSSLLRTFAHRIWQEVARARAETALRASEERHRLIFEQANDIIFTTDLDQVITSCNPASAAIFGTVPEALVGRPIRDFLTPENYAQTLRMLNHKLEHGGTTRHDIELMPRPGVVRRWEINSGLAIDRNGRPIGLNVIARDVTEQRAFEERQKLLIHELNHRVKNTLALVQGLALQSFKAGRTPAEGQAAFQARLASLAAAHDLLSREQWEGATLDELVADATRVYGDGSDRIHAGGPRIVVTPKAAIALVLALHELGTNAAKYGALSVPGGRVDIGWETKDGRLRIIWRESGGPPVTSPSRRGFGLRMIERALASDLSGTATVAFAPEGLVCTIDAPNQANPL
jgi:PAS domain S-box-containing protein